MNERMIILAGLKVPPKQVLTEEPVDTVTAKEVDILIQDLDDAIEAQEILTKALNEDVLQEGIYSSLRHLVSDGTASPASLKSAAQGMEEVLKKSFLTIDGAVDQFKTSVKVAFNKKKAEEEIQTLQHLMRSLEAIVKENEGFILKSQNCIQIQEMEEPIKLIAFVADSIKQLAKLTTQIDLDKMTNIHPDAASGKVKPTEDEFATDGTEEKKVTKGEPKSVVPPDASAATKAENA
jgi:hypothetical protein